MLKFLPYLIIGFCFHAKAQLPKCNLYQLEILAYEDKIRISNPLFLTPYNEDGYNNQPNFINSDEIIFTSNYKQSDSTDLWILNINDELLYRYTDTRGYSEYSPKNGIERDNIFTVRVDIDGTSQHLWQYPLDRSNSGKKIIKDLTTIGYYHFLSYDEVVLFLVGTPHTLNLYNLKEKTNKTIIENPGRTFMTDKDGLLYYVHKIGETNFLKSYNLLAKKAKTISVLPGKTEDFLLLNNKIVLIGDGSKIMKFNLDSSQNWEQVIDLSEMEINNISRMVFNRNKLIIVED